MGEFAPALNSDLIGVVAGYIPVTDDSFYELFPEAYIRRLKQDYKPDTKTIDGMLHTIDDDDPIIEDKNEHTKISWHRHGQLHRVNGPAYIDVYHGPCIAGPVLRKRILVQYFRYGMFHRLDGPAQIFYSGYSHTPEFRNINSYSIYGVHVYPPEELRHRRISVNVDCMPKCIIESLTALYPDPDTDPIVDLPVVDYKAWADKNMVEFREHLQKLKSESVPNILNIDFYEMGVKMYKKERLFAAS